MHSAPTVSFSSITSLEPYIILDVRAPGEFSQGHIPGAFSLPLFSDEERKRVGTLYKHDGKDAALYAGLDFAGEKLRFFVKEARRLGRGRNIIIHCWRGGMRSAAMGWLLHFCGLPVHILRGGYKAYRQHVHDCFESPLKLAILGGPTGSGKTAVLRALEQQGEQVIDLEAIAHHRGSAFGDLGMEPQPKNEQFENNLHHALSALDTSRTIWLEDENVGIGRVFIPEGLWKQMKAVTILRLDVPFAVRLKRLVKEYGQHSRELLEERIKKIGKRLGGQHLKAALAALQENDLEKVAAITLHYYDKAYLFNHKKRNAQVVAITTDTDNPVINAGKLIETFNRMPSWNQQMTQKPIA